ncbi:MAG: hypothetical protein A4E49_02477 [Methanosaeta sp. PtaU1.Bin112]|nr:MAG: hypothetical protein A4E49_02477 [Methanosaeta sp. PtaU1.Bin112]
MDYFLFVSPYIINILDIPDISIIFICHDINFCFMCEIARRAPDRSALDMEYKALRDEILVRIDLRQKLLATTLILAGAFLGFLANNPEYQSAALIYPPLAAFIAVAWTQDDYGIRDASIYIREYIEKEIPALRWEHYKRELRRTNRWHSIILLSHLGVIIITQFMALAIGLSVPTVEWYDYVPILVFCDLVSILLIIYLCVVWQRSARTITAKSRSILNKVAARRYGLIATKSLEDHDLDYEAAKKRVIEYFKENGQAYPSDIEDRLKLDYELVCKIAEELRREGRLEVL